ncbi:hypothetical protein ELY38_05610 [Vreelandella nanhaiensis]|uniref:Uncharacterized protein n=1 Tax=Vreelandella nanhaiensis TaxID=1258546 RepID=A0A3S0YZ12_9GAMM|nr:hypothetical protein ELY38_05610 [Halomonas nanhaiensis]
MSEKSASEGKTRQKLAKKRSLHVVNEYSEPIFNAVLPSIGTFQAEPKRSRPPPGQTCQTSALGP